MKFSIKNYAWLVTVLVWSASVTAQEENFNFEITPYGAYRFGGDFEETTGNISIEVDDNSSYGLILNARHSSITQWEILYSHPETSADTIFMPWSPTAFSCRPALSGYCRRLCRGIYLLVQQTYVVGLLAAHPEHIALIQ